jgi:hypothetical protein
MRHLKGMKTKKRIVDSKAWLDEPAYDVNAERAYMKRQMVARKKLQGGDYELSVNACANKLDALINKMR